MMDIPNRSGPMTTEAFVADRQHFWTGFTRLATYCAGAVALILVLMAIFLV